MADYEEKSYWLASSPYEESAPLDSSTKVDVAIVGGGFCGLSTAYYLKRADPSLRVAVLEDKVVGYGASGRNAGFAMTLLDASHRHLLHNYGEARARAAYQALVRSVRHIGEWAKEHDVDCEYEENGLLLVATNPGQERRVRGDFEAAERLGAGVRFLGREELVQEVNSPLYRCAIEEDACALINPAKLVRGLSRVVREMGVEVFEGTTAHEIKKGPPPLIITERGQVECEQLVLATNAYSVQFPELRRSVIPVYTYIVLTEPLTDAQWASIGWGRRQGIEDKRNYVHYYRPTSDGRIVWGGRDAVYYWGSGIGSRYDRCENVFRELEQSLNETFPSLKEVRLTHFWGGPVALTADFVPLCGTLQGTPIHYGLGYCGHGVAPSNTVGRILSDLVLGRETEDTELFFVNKRPLRYPPEPLRWMGYTVIRRTLLGSDQDMDSGAVGTMSDHILLRTARKIMGGR